ncbi:uncharacterized protein LOC121711766 [Alosa sapidissima]|uniref:uncharacterized protein LOC121711766 n=1 Tax=Alosa sapidissima TaxID=34773 RepID=UPI001C09AAD0|nr:uncharacterized protein LOC121711766 [Alosa sapidissima]
MSKPPYGQATRPKMLPRRERRPCPSSMPGMVVIEEKSKTIRWPVVHSPEPIKCPLLNRKPGPLVPIQRNKPKSPNMMTILPPLRDPETIHIIPDDHDTDEIYDMTLNRNPKPPSTPPVRNFHKWSASRISPDDLDMEEIDDLTVTKSNLKRPFLKRKSVRYILATEASHRLPTPSGLPTVISPDAPCDMTMRNKDPKPPSTPPARKTVGQHRRIKKRT